MLLFHQLGRFSYSARMFPLRQSSNVINIVPVVWQPYSAIFTFYINFRLMIYLFWIRNFSLNVFTFAEGFSKLFLKGLFELSLSLSLRSKFLMFRNDIASFCRRPRPRFSFGSFSSFFFSLSLPSSFSRVPFQMQQVTRQSRGRSEKKTDFGGRKW